LILAGILLLGDVLLAPDVSTLVIGTLAVAVGAFEIIYAFWARGWVGFVLQLALGALYVVPGSVLLSQPIFGAPMSDPSSGVLFVTYVLGLLLLLSGLLRIALGFFLWADIGWTMLLSGLFGSLAGIVILTGFPKATLWLLALLLGVDLIAQGVAWLANAWATSERRQVQ
jgi:uncharacterized membrane protein HdeD (DUF308 family)